MRNSRRHLTVTFMTFFCYPRRSLSFLSSLVLSASVRSACPPCPGQPICFRFSDGLFCLDIFPFCIFDGLGSLRATARPRHGTFPGYISVPLLPFLFPILHVLGHIGHIILILSKRIRFPLAAFLLRGPMGSLIPLY
jgi:hypothetical protein